MRPFDKFDTVDIKANGEVYPRGRVHYQRVGDKKILEGFIDKNRKAGVVFRMSPGVLDRVNGFDWAYSRRWMSGNVYNGKRTLDNMVALADGFYWVCYWLDKRWSRSSKWGCMNRDRGW